MRIGTRRRAGVTLLELEGKLLVGRGDVALREAVESLLSAGESRILVDLHGVTRIDSSGMAELIAAYSKVKIQGGMLKLLRLPPKVQSILGVTQLMTVFDIFDEEDEAIASFE